MWIEIDCAGCRRRKSVSIKTKSERKMEADERVFGSVGMCRARALGENVVLSKEVSGRCFEREYSVICCLSWSIWWWR